MCIICFTGLLKAENNNEHKRDSIPWAPKFLHQGNFLLMAETGAIYNNLKVKENGNKESNFNLNLCAGYFPINRFAIGPEISFSSSKTVANSDGTNYTTKFNSQSYGLWGRYYPEIGKDNSMVAPFQPYLGAEYTLGASRNSYPYGTSTSETKYKDSHYDVMLGFDLPLCCHCAALNFYAGYDWSKEVNKDNSSDKLTTSGFTTGLAFDVFFRQHHQHGGKTGY